MKVLSFFVFVTIIVIIAVSATDLGLFFIPSRIYYSDGDREQRAVSLREEKTAEEEIKEKAIYKSVMTTVFWVGEEASEDNSFISNAKSAWDIQWMKNYGGKDSPFDRCGYRPCSFRPKENPFYFALPYDDMENDVRKESAVHISWYKENDNIASSIVKNRWIEIVYKERNCYAQWEDVGPYETDDFDYVFGNSPPKNIIGVGAGLDISPAAWDYLRLEENDFVEWRFIERAEVPLGPWVEIETYN